uniref:Uncharacterized protein n=1 Tax=Cacopsylla melanoneura TaxID=428564 RepID=A0A8D8QU36_9HEMI
MGGDVTLHAVRITSSIVSSTVLRVMSFSCNRLDLRVDAEQLLLSLLTGEVAATVTPTMLSLGGAITGAGFSNSREEHFISRAGLLASRFGVTTSGVGFVSSGDFSEPSGRGLSVSSSSESTLNS